MHVHGEFQGYRSTASFRARLLRATSLASLTIVGLTLAQAPMPAAFAQSAAPASNAPTAPAGEVVPEVQVTGSHTVEAVSEQQATAFQDTPQAATVVTQKQIENLNINSIKDAQKLEPSLAIKSYNVRNLTFNIRGFGSDRVNATDTIFGGVPIYIDGVYQPRPGQAVFDIPDLTGVNVLKGPQGTLGGQDSTGGAIYATTALPSFATGQTLEVSTGNYGYIKFKGSATGAIGGSDVFAYRLSAFGSDREGYAYSVSQPGQKYFDWHDKGVRGQILYQPNNDLTVRGVVDYSHVNQACCSEYFNGAIVRYANGQPITPNFYQLSLGAGYFPPTQSALYTNQTDILGYKQTAVESEGAALLVDYTLHGFRFSSVTAYRGWDFHPNNRDSGIIAPQLYTNSNGHVSPERSVEQELKVSTPTGLPVEATAGLFYLHENLYDFGLTTTGGQTAQFFDGPGPVTLANLRALNYAGQQSYDNATTDEIAPYARGVWHATSNIDVTAGLRYSSYEKSSLWRRYIYSPIDPTGLTAAQYAAAQAEQRGFFGANAQFASSVHQEFLSPLASFQYKVTPDVTAYFTWAKGGRGGGATLAYNLRAPLDVKPEDIDSTEAGVKAQFFDQRLLVNFAAFWMNDRNYITQEVDNSTGHPTTFLGNAKLATSRGLELDLRAKPVDGLETFASFAYDDAFYSSFRNGVCPFEYSYLPYCDLSGKRLALAPRFAFSAGGEYAYKLGRFDSISPVPLVAYVGGDVTYQSATESTPDDSRYAVISPYAIANFHLGVRTEDSSVNLEAWVKNAFNHRYWQALWAGNWDLGVGEIGGQPADPLYAGVTLRTKFPGAAAAAPSLFGPPALTADLPSRKGPPAASPTAFTWQGVYVGADLGYAWAQDKTVPLYFPGVDFPLSFGLTGVIGGLHAGYNWQINPIVLGLETEFDATSLSRTVQQDPLTTLRSASTLQGSIRARFGYAFDRFLVFGTGGSQWAGVQNSYQAFGFSDSYSTTRHTWVVGGGLEYALTDNWLARAEYRYSDLGTRLDGNGPIIAPLFYQSHHWQEDRVTAGISWKFAASPEK